MQDTFGRPLSICAGSTDEALLTEMATATKKLETRLQALDRVWLDDASLPAERLSAGFAPYMPDVFG
jgi:hypothetical protein